MEPSILVNQYRRKRFSTKASTFVKKNWGQALIVIFVAIFAVMVLTPLAILLLRSFKVPQDDMADPFGFPKSFTFENYVTIWGYIQNAYVNSFITTIGVTLGVVVCATLLAYAFIRFHFPLKRFLFFAIIALMMIPGILTLISRYQEVAQMGMINSLAGVIVPGIAGYIPGAFMLLFTFFNGIPKELFEAADIDGANDFTVYLKIVLPLSKPIIWTIGIQTFVGEWNDYLWAKIILSDESKTTLPVILQSITSPLGSQVGYALPFAGYVLSALPLVIIFILASKQFIAGLTSGAFKM